MPNRKKIDRYMIDNVRVRTQKKKLELKNTDIEIDPQYFDSLFIATYRDTYNNYTEGEFLIVVLFD